MKTNTKFLGAATLALFLFCALSYGQNLKINDLDYFEGRGFNTFVYSNVYQGIFCDEKEAGVELILRGVRVATGGGVRLMNTPEQWDIYPELGSRTVDKAAGTITVVLNYPDYDFSSKLVVSSAGKGVNMSLYLDKPIPAKLEGKAGMNIEFFPATYFGKTFLMDGAAGILPERPAADTQTRPVSEKVPQFYGLSTFDDRGRGEFIVPSPLASGHKLVLAPEDDNLRVAISSADMINLFDGRVLAQNGTFVVRTILPSGKTGKVAEWNIEPSYDAKWVRQPNVGFSQIGYTPAQKKVSVIELDRNDKVLKSASIIRIKDSGERVLALTVPVKEWGVFNNRYKYAMADFSSITEPGLYCIEYGNVKTNPFPVGKNVYDGKWHTTMDVWLPVQMDHMEVNEGYRTWHGKSHMDDALQAPLNYSQFDGYTQKGETNTKYAPLEHIPNLAVGAWYDAGDFDIQSGTVTGMTSNLTDLWELFRPDRDETYVDETTKFVDIHRPDGIPDVIQQILHGALNVNAQIENIGFIAQGIVQGNLYQYHHLGDGSTITDNLVYNPALKPYQTDCGTSGTRDDRLAFTSNFTPAGTMSAVASLAAAARVLKPYYPEEAARCLKNALALWEKYYIAADPANRDSSRRNRFGDDADFDFSSFGGFGFGDPRTSAAIQLWRTTGDDNYKQYFVNQIVSQLTPRQMPEPSSASRANSRFRGSMVNITAALEIYPYMDKDFQAKVKAAVPYYLESVKAVASQNPYGVPVSGRGWGGNEQVISWAYNNYLVWRYFPDMIDPETVLGGLDFLYGCHPYSNISFVNSVGVKTKKVAYGNNRADYTVIPGGIVPGLLMLAPDFMENKDDYPFLWGENECCTRTVPSYVGLSIACEEVAKAINK